MPWPKGVPKGEKTGGRKKGVPNKRTLEIREIFEVKGCCPFSIMAEIALNPAHPPDLRLRAASDIAGYIAPKLRSIERIDDNLNREREFTREEKELILEFAGKAKTFLEEKP